MEKRESSVLTLSWLGERSSRGGGGTVVAPEGVGVQTAGTALVIVVVVDGGVLSPAADITTTTTSVITYYYSYYYYCYY